VQIDWGRPPNPNPTEDGLGWAQKFASGWAEKSKPK